MVTQNHLYLYNESEKKNPIISSANYFILYMHVSLEVLPTSLNIFKNGPN